MGRKSAAKREREREREREPDTHGQEPNMKGLGFRVQEGLNPA